MTAIDFQRVPPPPPLPSTGGPPANLTAIGTVSILFGALTILVSFGLIITRAVQLIGAGRFQQTADEIGNIELVQCVAIGSLILVALAGVSLIKAGIAAHNRQARTIALHRRAAKLFLFGLVPATAASLFFWHLMGSSLGQNLRNGHVVYQKVATPHQILTLFTFALAVGYPLFILRCKSLSRSLIKKSSRVSNDPFGRSE
jgi:hypothetical protein